MAKFTLELGATADVLNAAELAEELLKAEIRAAARAAGYKWTEQALPNPASPLTPTVQLGGPNPGFAWKMRLISVSLAAAGTFCAFKGEAAAGQVSRPIGTPVATVQLALAGGTLNLATMFFPDDIVIQTDQQVFIAATQNIVTYYYGAVQVPGPRLPEHLS